MAEPKNKNMIERLADGRYRIREKLIVDGNKAIKIPLTESNQIVEVDGKKYTCRGAYAGVEISRPNKENLNERIYTDGLWNRVITKQKCIWDGGPGLANHPEKESDVLKTFCVWRNLQFNEKKDLIVADMYLVGEHTGQLAKEILDAGGKLGLSSSGFGDFKEDGKTIDESTYELERVADWVDAPSYEVYAKKDNEIKSKSSEKSENKEKNNKKVQLSETDSTNIIENNVSKENIMPDTTVNENLAPLEQKNFRMNIRRLLSEADKENSLSKRLQEYKEIQTYFNGVNFAPQLEEQVNDSINTLIEEILALAEKGKSLDSIEESSKIIEEKTGKLAEENRNLKEELEKVTEKYEIAQTMLEEIREYAKNLKEMNRIAIAEKNGMVEPEEYLTLYRKYESLLSEQDKKGDDKKGDDKKGDEEEKDKEGDEEMEDEKDKEEMFDFSNKKSVEAYYNDLSSQYPKIKGYKKDFMACKTIFEAQKFWLNLEEYLYGLPPRKPVTEKKNIAYSNRRRSEGIGRLVHKGWE